MQTKYNKNFDLEVMSKSSGIIYRLFQVLQIVSIEIDGLRPHKKELKSEFWQSFVAIDNIINALKLRLKKEMKSEYSEVFENLTNDHLYALGSIIHKCMYLTESQILDLENQIEIFSKEDKKIIDHKEFYELDK